MRKIITTPYFDRELKKFIKKSANNRKFVEPTLNLLLKNFKHPSLKVEKLQGQRNVYSARVNKGNRLFFTILNENSILLIDIGPHDKYRKY